MQHDNLTVINLYFQAIYMIASAQTVLTISEEAVISWIKEYVMYNLSKTSGNFIK